MLVRASSANVDWNPKDKKWHIQVHVGAEVIKRPLPDCLEDYVTEDNPVSSMPSSTSWIWRR